MAPACWGAGRRWTLPLPVVKMVPADCRQSRARGGTPPPGVACGRVKEVLQGPGLVVLLQDLILSGRWESIKLQSYGFRNQERGKVETGIQLYYQSSVLSSIEIFIPEYSIPFNCKDTVSIAFWIFIYGINCRNNRFAVQV